MIGNGTHWFVAHTHVHAEAKAAFNLARQGYAVFFPRYRKRRSHARKVEMVRAPLFPRYVFVQVDVGAQRWRSINSTIGIVHLVCHGDEPAVVPHRVIAELKGREDADGLIKLDPPAFKSGDKVVVQHCAFENCLGLFERMTDRERVIVLLELLGRKVRVAMDAAAVAAA